MTYCPDPDQETVACMVRAFEHHKAERIGPGLWRCKAPNTIIHSFHVAFLPGTIAVFGDIGELLLRPGYDSAPWALSTSRGTGVDYWLSKAPHTMVTSEFCGDRARENLEELLRDDNEARAEEGKPPRTMDDVFVGEVENENEYYERAIELGCASCDVPSARVYTQNAVWCVHAIRWLIAQVGPALLEQA